MKSNNLNKIVIEYCPGCQWLLRSAWMAQEILNTFENELEVKPSSGKKMSPVVFE